MQKLAGVLAAIAAIVVGVGPVEARDLNLKRGYREVPPDAVPPSEGLISGGHVIFFNRNGGQYTYGQIDSRTNKNGIGTGNLTPFNCGDAAWQKVMDCLKDTFGPYNVVITDVDPGNAPHSEVVVAGKPGEIGESNGVAGVANMGCGLSIDNPVAFAFANIYYPSCDTDDICWTAAQEIAHSYGLDHEIACKDPMTYDYSCGTYKRFQNESVHCGEDTQSQHNCYCDNAANQNSHQMLLEIFGPRVNAAPSVTFNKPADGATVQSGFGVYLTTEDDVKTTKVELYIDGTLYQTSELGGPTWQFGTDANLSMGNHTIRAKAFDAGGLTGEQTVNVKVEPPCHDNGDCGDNEVCNVSNGQCVAGPGQTGGLGSTCTDSTMCESGVCAAGPDGMRCVTICTPGGTDCPDGFDCLSAGSSGACWPGADVINPPPEGGCGCRAGGHGGAGAAGVLSFAFLALVVTRRRRSR